MSNKSTRPLEFATRKKIDLMLTNLGWNTDEESPGCNSFAGRAKTKEQNKKFRGTQPDYVLYQSGTDTPVAIIEAKRKGESIEDAVTQGEGYANALGVKIVFAYDGAFFKSWHIGSEEELFVEGQVVTQLITEKKLLRFVEEGHRISEVTAKVKHTRTELINTFKWANDMLRKEGLREGIERFTEFANLLFLKLITELENEREKEGDERILARQYSWESFCNLDESTMMNYINNTVLPYLVEKYNHSGDVFAKELLIKNPKTLKSIVNRLSSIDLMNADSDVKGDAFEYFLKDSITIGNDLGEYFTPRHIVNLMIELIEPKFGEKIYDPTCGTGGFLIAAFNYIKKRVAKEKANLRKLKEETIYGREFTNTSKIAKMNMILTGDGHNNIKQMDSLANPVKGVYHVVLANPPYAQTTDHGNYYPVPSSNGDAIFIQHIIESLRDGGRAAVVVPEGLLFGRSERDVRKYILQNCNVIAIISLPQGVFKPYASSKTNIIVLDKNNAGTKSIWFYNLEYDGFDLSSDLRKPTEENDIADLLSKWSDKVESEKSWIVDIKRIEENNYDLLAKTYQPKRKATTKFALVPFSEIMKEDKGIITINDSKEYHRITVKLHGNGIVPRDKVSGKDLKIKQQKIVKEDQFIVAEIDAKLGAFGVIPKELAGAIVSSHYFLFDLDKSRVNPEYFDYVIRYGSYEKLIQPFVKGTTNYASIRPKDILKLRLPLPDPDIQEIIAERIRRQELIMFNTDSARNSIKEALIDQSDFDGNWPLMDLEEVCQEIRNGGTPTRTNPSFFGGGVPWVKSGELEDNIIEKTEETLTKKGLESSNAKILPKGTVLIALYGATIGKTAILEIDASTNQAVSGLVPKTSKIVSEYLRYYLCTLRPYYMQKARGSAQRNINTEIMKSVKVPVPSKSVQIEIVRKIDDRKTILSDLEATKKRSRSVIGQIVQSIGQADYILDSEKTKRISDFQ